MIEVPISASGITNASVGAKVTRLSSMGFKRSTNEFDENGVFLRETPS